MSISSVARAALAALLPQDCVLCGAASGDSALCGDCTENLPRLPAPCCPVCALPTPAGATCGTCLRSPPAFDASFAPWTYAFPADKLVQALKFSHRLPLAGTLAAAMLAGPRPSGDLLMPLPLAPARLRDRGFNQALEIARPLAKSLGIPLAVDTCRRTRDTVPQSSLPWKARRRNIKGAFECSVDLSGKAIVVIDDVMTTGATLDEFASVLKRHGAARVSNWVAARALRD